ncbi:MAG TPA: hypothetical protein VLK28_10930 [Methylomirabilota bacterium]|nr:hypothetical protein [Methylomirabilota bacterium]
MTLEMLIGAVGIVVAAITFVAGMLAFSALDRAGVEEGSARRGEPAGPTSSGVR